MRRLATCLTLVVALAPVGCGSGGDDDDGDGGGDGGDDGGGDAGDDGGGDDGSTGGAACSGDVSGASSGAFDMCGAVVNHYPDGSFVIGDRAGWLFTMIDTSVIGTLDPPLDSVGVNFELSGAPEAGTYELADAVPGVTSGVVTLADDTLYGDLVDIELVVDELEQVTDQVIEGDRIVSFEVRGSVELTLEAEGGAQVTVRASF
ncbi:MAG TPA: hypothetical protein VKB80_36745 [Kofleriaceae bacterium]|nr:hypothetical protein [Kofleriaceae bacterium]